MIGRALFWTGVALVGLYLVFALVHTTHKASPDDPSCYGVMC